jgi:hypothetical protein
MDYIHYYNDLRGRWETHDTEFLYKTIVELLSGGLNLPYWGSFMIYSLLLISSVLFVFKIYPKAAVWGLPLFFIITQDSAENIIRQYLAVSFVLFAYYAFLNRKNMLIVIFLCCVPLIHLSGLIAIVFFISFGFFKIPLKSPWPLIVIFVALYFFWDVQYFSGFTDFFSTLNLGGDVKMQGYLDDSDRWFSEEGSISVVLKGKKHVNSSSILSMFFKFSSQVLIIFYGFKTQLQDRKLQIPFYFAYIAILFNVIGGDIEIYARFCEWFNYLTPFIIGIFMYRMPMKRFERYSVITILLVNYLFYSFIRIIGNIPYSGFAFVWDR